MVVKVEKGVRVVLATTVVKVEKGVRAVLATTSTSHVINHLIVSIMVGIVVIHQHLRL